MNHFQRALQQACDDNNEALVHWFREAPLREAVAALHILLGCPSLPRISVESLRRLVLEAAEVPPWLAERCDRETGAPLETLARLWPRDGYAAHSPADILQALHKAPASLPPLFDGMNASTRLLVLRLLTAPPRPFLPRNHVALMLARVYDSDAALLEIRLTRGLPDSPAALEALLHPAPEYPPSNLHPFPFPDTPLFPDHTPLPRGEWSAEWKWDGLRAQLLRRDDEILLWSRDQGLVNDRFPQILDEAASLPEGCVLDGILLSWQNEHPLSPLELGRPGIPTVFMAWDCPEIHGVDLRSMPLFSRRMQLLPMLGNLDLPSFRSSEPLRAHDGEHLGQLRARARSIGASGLVLKDETAPFGPGHAFALPCPPLLFNALLLYQVSGPIPEYAFGLREKEGWTSILRIKSDHPDLARIAREHQTERKGQVLGIAPICVCEMAIDQAWPSKRHRCGWRFEGARIQRISSESPPSQIQSLEELSSHWGLPNKNTL